MIITSRFPKNLVWTCLINVNQRSINFNILFPINEISSSIINYNWSYFLTKLSNCSKLNDGKSLQLRGIERIEWIVLPSILNATFPIYAMSKTFFVKGFEWKCLL